VLKWKDIILVFVGRYNCVNMNELVVVAVVGVGCLLLIVSYIYLRQVVCCCKSLNEEEVEGPTEPQQYDMTPSEVNEFRDFEKAIQGEIYADNISGITKNPKSNGGSPNPKGFEKFRRIPSLASESSFRKKKAQKLKESNKIDEGSSAGGCESLVSFKTESVDSIDDIGSMKNESVYDVEDSFTIQKIPMTDRSGGSDDGFSRPISSTRVAKSFMMNHFSNSVDSTLSMLTKPVSVQEQEKFSIANDIAEL
jgi:hypothetical protein